MGTATNDEQEDFHRWLTSELRAKVNELIHHQPDGDFCTDLAAWLIAAGHVQLPSDKIACDRELATVRMQRDRAWHQLTVVEKTHRSTTTPAAALRPASDSNTVEV